MALVERRANYRVGARAGAVLAGIGAGAGVAVAACHAIRLQRAAARAVRGVALAHIVTLILWRASDPVAAGTGAGLAGIGARACVAIIAGRPVCLGRVRAHPGRRVTDAGRMALVAGCTHHGIAADAGAALAGIGQRAGISVVATSAIRLRGTTTGSSRWVADAHVVALITGAGATYRVGTHTHASLASVGLCAGVAVVTRCAVRQGGIAANPSRRIACPGRVALIAGGARHRVGAHAHAGLAGTALRAWVSAIARHPVGLR